ncbi:hypothetical protein G7045_01665 [Acidovorax sp. HDW3]|uniref:Ig domain-containing protein n=1 Tax=Acidovorax sp. HDW3 TaxID=2714923 RepID=UPI0014091AA2|nr:Ig domain-containing protein [Acidovorax sp. HDW3]QIL43073.1 hypothetical protein G7045_01665 [Acidovorax sp. HDW3]
MNKVLNGMALLALAGLSACGGGGGSSGSGSGGGAAAEYEITLRADKVVLPVNVAGVGPGKGVYSPYTTVLYVQATVAGQPIPGGVDIFGCNVSGGLNSGSLYYLDGNPDHEIQVDDGQGGKISVPGAYRSITLGSNAGGNSFHFHAGNQVGTSRVTCAVTDPRDKQQKSASIDITVGGPTGKVASIEAIAAYKSLGSQGNLNNVPTASAIQVQVRDDSNQPVSAGGGANLQVGIVSGAGSLGATLLSSQNRTSVAWVSTVNGVGTFSLSSGQNEGVILLEIKADRFDNDVTNGLQDPVVSYLAVPVSNGAVTAPTIDPVVLVDVATPDAANGIPYAYALSAKGGVAPYTWVSLGGLPNGLSLSSSGVISGTPSVTLPGAYNVSFRVTDNRGTSLTGNATIKVDVTPGIDPLLQPPLAINLSGCGSDVNAACAITIANPTAPFPEFFYQRVLSVSGPGTGLASWAVIQNPSWVTMDPLGILFVRSSDATTSPALMDCTSDAFFIRATRGGQTTMRKVKFVIGSGAGVCKF